jgi:ubiquitin-like-conjugating enzyme ATG3
MKKFIDRMEASQEDEAAATTSPGGKRRWLGGVMRKVTGADKDKKEAAAAAAAASKDEDYEPKGLQVDFYLVIFLKFIASIVPTIEVDSTTATNF